MQHLKQSNFFTKNFLPFILALLLISVISIRSMYHLEDINSAMTSSEYRLQVENNFDNQIRLYGKMFSGYLDFIAHDKKIISLFKEAKREELYVYCKPILERLKKQYNISHFYFHSLDKKVFLRVHNKQRHSDFINRYTLAESMRTQKMFAGIELGVLNTLTLRVVVPWRVDGKIIAYLELGEDIDYMAYSISKMLNVSDVVIALRKEMSTWVSDKKLLNEHMDLGEFVIIDTTMKKMGEKIQKLIRSDISHEDVNFMIQESSYIVNSIALRNAKGDTLGKIVLFTKSEKAANSFENLVLRSSLMIALISLFLILFYYIYVSNILRISVKDDMTKLYNRRYFDRNSIEQLKQAQEKDLFFTLLIIDIDNFKLFNDAYGHLKGDEVLKSVAKILADYFNEEDEVVYRIGGEEFAVIFNTSQREGCQERIESLIESVYNAKIVHEMNEAYGYITISVGCVSKKMDKNTVFKEIYKQTDENLYEAKRSGRNRLVFVDN